MEGPDLLVMGKLRVHGIKRRLDLLLCYRSGENHGKVPAAIPYHNDVLRTGQAPRDLFFDRLRRDLVA